MQILVSNPAIHFAVYEGLKRVLLLRHASRDAKAVTRAAGHTAPR